MFRIALSAFVMVFLAELGDKTQLAVFALATRTHSPWPVLIGAGSALVFSTFLAVGLGYFLSRAVPTGWIKSVHYAAGALFILTGIWTIWKA